MWPGLGRNDQEMDKRKESDSKVVARLFVRGMRTFSMEVNDHEKIPFIPQLNFYTSPPYNHLFIIYPALPLLSEKGMCFLSGSGPSILTSVHQCSFPLCVSFGYSLYQAPLTHKIYPLSLFSGYLYLCYYN